MLLDLSDLLQVSYLLFFHFLKNCVSNITPCHKCNPKDSIQQASSFSLWFHDAGQKNQEGVFLQLESKCLVSLCSPNPLLFLFIFYQVTSQQLA